MNITDILSRLNDTTSLEVRLELMEELYWAEYGDESSQIDLNALGELLLGSKSIEEYAAVQKLYSNPEGALLDFYQDIIIRLYTKDPMKFIKASTEYPDEGLNVLYIFRNNGFFKDYKTEENELLALTDSEDSRELITQFFRMYDSLCHT